MVYLWFVNNMVKKKKNLKKNILVTGGTGFIGSAITKYLVENGYSVTVLDNNSRGKQRRLDSIFKEIRFINCDIRDIKKIKLIKGNFDTIVHLAYVNGTKFFYEKPFEILDIGVNGFLNILEFAKKKKIKNFFLASSSEVYQNPLKVPTDEKEMLKIPDIHNPRYSYGGGKIFSELYGIHFAQKYLKKFIIFRPHNVYGADMGNEHVIPEFINRFKKIANKKKFLIRGTGNEIRSFIHIDDFINGFDKVFLKGKNLEIYNIGTDKKVKIISLVKILSKLLNKKVSIIKTKISKGSPIIRCPNINKIKKIGFRPKISLKNGLKKIINHD